MTAPAASDDKRVQTFVLKLLASRGGWIRASEGFDAAHAAGITRGQVTDARRILGIPVAQSARAGGWVWGDVPEGTGKFAKRDFLDVSSPTAFFVIDRKGIVLAERPAIEAAVRAGRALGTAVAVVGAPSGVWLASVGRAVNYTPMAERAVALWKRAQAAQHQPPQQGAGAA